MGGHEIFANLKKNSVIKKKKLWKERQLMTADKKISQLYKETDDTLKGFKRGRCPF